MNSTPIIEKTKEYEKFKFLNFNREKSRNHIDTLKKIIQENNLLSLHPILVNDQMEIVDGQHRLIAAQELGVEIFYIKNNVPYEHILGSNLYQKKLSLLEVIKFYAVKDKISSYIFLCKQLEELKINPKALLGCIFGKNSKLILDFIKTGKFQLPDHEEKIRRPLNSLKEFLCYVQDKKIRPFSMFTSFKFTIAYRNLVSLSNFNEEIWFKKLEQRWFDLKPQINSDEWSRLLVGIYNWKNQSPLNYVS